MNTAYMIKKLYKSADEIQSQENPSDDDRKKMVREMRMFFGPSKQFSSVFKAALLCSVELNLKYGKDNPDLKFKIEKEPLFD